MNVKIKYGPDFSLESLSEIERSEIESDLEILSAIGPDRNTIRNGLFLDMWATGREIEVLPRNGISWKYKVRYFHCETDYTLGEHTYGREDVKELKK